MNHASPAKEPMVHYHVWFNLKPGVDETRGLEVVAGYLSQLTAAAESAGYSLRKNNGAPPRSKLPKYHALVEFAGFEQLGAAMKNQAERGIHTAGHGRIVEIVCDFHVEIFSLLPAANDAAQAGVIGAQACEI